MLDNLVWFILLGVLAVRARGHDRLESRILDMQGKLSTAEGKQQTMDDMVARGRRRVSERDLERFASRLTQSLANVEYFRREPLGWREGTAVVWAGMRGAVTVAAAQTLPEDTPQRSVLVLIAFAVATMSLLVQGGTIGPLLRVIAPRTDPAVAEAERTAERQGIMDLMRATAESVPAPSSPDSFGAARLHQLTVIGAQRTALLDARDHGSFDADVLAYALANLDASEIAIEMRGRP